MSPSWKALRRDSLARDSHRCRLCDACDDLDVHHRRYPPNGRWDLDCLDALTTLCNPCHQRTTSDLRSRRYLAQARPVVNDVARLTPITTQGGPSERLRDIALQDQQQVSALISTKPL